MLRRLETFGCFCGARISHGAGTEGTRWDTAGYPNGDHKCLHIVVFAADFPQSLQTPHAQSTGVMQSNASPSRPHPSTSSEPLLTGEECF